MDAKEFASRRRFAETASGRIAFVETGTGPIVLFIYGVPLNGYHWRHVMTALHSKRRCIAIDLMGLGYTEVGSDQGLSFAAQARMIGQFLDALQIDKVDLVGNDTGGGGAQVFAARNPHRLRSLTLTNCDVHDGWPAAAVLPAVEAARAGTLADGFVQLLRDPAEARTRFARAYARSEVLTDESVRMYFEPLVRTAERRDAFHRFWLAFDNRETTAIEAELRRLVVPTLIVWGLDDVFFDVKWAHWLKAAIPGPATLVEVAGARLFFPEDMPEALVGPLQGMLQVTA